MHTLVLFLRLLLLVERVEPVNLPDLGLLIELLLLLPLRYPLLLDLLEQEVATGFGVILQALGSAIFLLLELHITLSFILLDLKLFLLCLCVCLLDHCVSHVRHKCLLALLACTDFPLPILLLLCEHPCVGLLGLDVL